MAVTVVSSPPVSPFVLSASYPAVIEMTSNIYGGAGITQFRYVAEVTAIIDLGVKYTVPAVASISTGYFDVHELFKLLLFLRPEQYDAGTFDGDPLTQITTPIQQASFVHFSFQVVIKEQYYNAGVFTTNTGPTLVFKAGRGWTDKTDSEWVYTNWWQYNGLSDFLPYSGLTPQVFCQRTEDSTWPTTAAEPWQRIWITQLNGGAVIQDSNFNRTTVGFQGAVYVQLYHAGQTDIASFTGVQIRVYTGTTSGGPWNLQELITIEKTVEFCDDENLIMFQDRFLQWSFMPFTKHRYTTVNTQPQEAEAVDGRFRYNVKSSDTLTLNTDWLDDQQNELMSDLIATEQTFLVDPDDGSLEKLTVVPNSLRLQTSKVNGLHQYQMQFRKSIDNFKP